MISVAPVMPYLLRSIIVITSFIIELSFRELFIFGNFQVLFIPVTISYTIGLKVSIINSQQILSWNTLFLSKNILWKRDRKTAKNSCPLFLFSLSEKTGPRGFFSCRAVRSPADSCLISGDTERHRMCPYFCSRYICIN